MLIAAALVGTDRSPFVFPPLPPDHPLARAIAATDDPLTIVAVVSTYRRAGTLPNRNDVTPLALCDLDDLPPTNAKASALLDYLAYRHPKRDYDLLSEWFTLAIMAGQRLPGEMLPYWLSYAHGDRKLRPFVAALLGKRGRWLAAQNPYWAYILEAQAEPAGWYAWDEATARAKITEMAGAIRSGATHHRLTQMVYAIVRKLPISLFDEFLRTLRIILQQVPGGELATPATPLQHLTLRREIHTAFGR